MSYSFECQCGYSAACRIGNVVQKLDHPEIHTVESPVPPLWRRMLGEKQKPPRRFKVFEKNVPTILAHDHHDDELVSVDVRIALDSDRYTAFAAGAVESVGLASAGVNLKHPGPALYCPKCKMDSIAVNPGLHIFPQSPRVEEVIDTRSDGNEQ